MPPAFVSRNKRDLTKGTSLENGVGPDLGQPGSIWPVIMWLFPKFNMIFST